MAADLAKAMIQGPKLHMRPHAETTTTTPPSLTDYCTSMGVAPVSNCGNALRVILGAAVMGQMDFNVHFQTAALSWPVDPDKSVVQFEDLEISAPVSSAGLVFALPPRDDSSCGHPESDCHGGFPHYHLA
jgi:hypothetical protein